MLSIPFLSDDSQQLHEYDAVLQFISGSGDLYYQDASSSAKEILLKPNTKDSASKLLYSAAYLGMPDAQLALAPWNLGAGNFVEALAWADLASRRRATHFLEEGNGRYASVAVPAVVGYVDYNHSDPKLDSARRECHWKGKAKFRELSEKCRTDVQGRQLLVDFLKWRESVVQIQSKNLVSGMAWFGYQFLAANLVDAPTLAFDEVLRLDPNNKIAAAFQAGLPGLKSAAQRKAEFHQLIDQLTPLLHAMGPIQNGLVVGSSTTSQPYDPYAETEDQALSLWNKGDVAGAGSLYLEALTGRERIFGPDHPATIESVSNLARLLSAMGEFARAESFFRRALEARYATLGPEHRDTLLIQRDFAFTLAQTGDLEGAESTMKRTVEGLQKILPPEDAGRQAAENGLAVIQQLRVKRAGS